MKLAIFVLILLCAPNAQAMGKKRPKPEGMLRTSLQVLEVKLPKKNRLAGSWPESLSCSDFRGTHAGNTIEIELKGEGGDGKYRHELIYTLTRAYQLGRESEGQREKSQKGNGSVKIELPELDDGTPFVQQTLFLLTRDGTGATATSSLTFLVARPVVLGVSADARAREKDCLERYAPYESQVGLLSNGSTNLSTIQIKQGLQTVWSSTRGWQWGVYVSPFSWLGLGNLLALNLSYFSQTSKQTVETVEIDSSYALSPGDYLQVYVQPTRYVTAYDATLIDPCGKAERLDGAYLFQWWGFAYHVYPVNPLSDARPPVSAVGAPVVNTCPQALTPGGDASIPGSALGFVRTNL